MVRADVITLIGDNPKAHGVFDTDHTETERDVFVTVKSVTYKEAYISRGGYNSGTEGEGLNPSLIFVLSLDADYQGEKKCRYHDELYRIVRAWLRSDGGIELTAARFEDG